MEFNTTDLGNAKRFVIQHCLDVKYVSGWGWLHWDGMCWKKDTTGVISRKAKETILSIYHEITRRREHFERRKIIMRCKLCHSEIIESLKEKTI